jgi:hypothetical protein
MYGRRAAKVSRAHAMFASVCALAPAQGQARDSGAGHHPAGRGQPIVGRGTVEFLPRGAALGPDHLLQRVDPDPAHRRQVDHQAAVGDRQAGHVVAAAADRDLGRLLAAEPERVHHVGHRAAAGDQRGPFVDQPVVHAAGLLVGRIRGADQLAAERRPDLV